MKIKKIQRKRRPRQHIIAAISETHLDASVHECGFTIEHIRQDYGYDAVIFTFDAQGEHENGSIYVQLKATERLRKSSDGRKALYSISKRDLSFWQDEFMPVYLVLFDAREKIAYWVYLQRYLERKSIKASTLSTNSLTVEIDLKNVVNAAAVLTWRKHKKKMMAQIRVTHA